jgi:hypothetical protein
MIRIEVTRGDFNKSISFPEGRKGNSDSRKFLEDLRDLHLRHPHYLLERIDAKIHNLELIIAGTSRRGKKRFNLEVKLRILQAEREQFLKANPGIVNPGLLKVSITHN